MLYDTFSVKSNIYESCFDNSPHPRVEKDFIEDSIHRNLLPVTEKTYKFVKTIDDVEYNINIRLAINDYYEDFSVSIATFYNGEIDGKKTSEMNLEDVLTMLGKCQKFVEFMETMVVPDFLEELNKDIRLIIPAYDGREDSTALTGVIYYNGSYYIDPNDTHTEIKFQVETREGKYVGDCGVLYEWLP